jgi:hypothetical protein
MINTRGAAVLVVYWDHLTQLCAAPDTSLEQKKCNYFRSACSFAGLGHSVWSNASEYELCSV